MRKLLFFLFFCALSIYANAQGTALRSWELTGNANSSTRYFLGTTDCSPLIFKTNNTERMRLLSDRSFLGIGTVNPFAPLHLHYQIDNQTCETINSDDINLAPLPVKLMQLTTSVTGDGSNQGFGIFYSIGKDVIFSQREQGNFNLIGPGGGLTIAPNGNIGVGVSPSNAKFEVNGLFKAQTSNITGAFTAQTASITGALTAQTASITGALSAQTATVVGNTYLKGNVTVGTGIKMGIDSTIVLPEIDRAGGGIYAQFAHLDSYLLTKYLCVNHPATQDWTYASQVNVNNDKTKALVITNNSSGVAKEVCVVYGNGVLSTKKIFTEKVEITMNALNNYWYDHVFYSDYQLRPLKELEKFIRQNHHLPEIPSAQEVMENGLDLGEMQGKLLLKIEELTLYILDLQKQIDELKNKKP